jgi:hypothetical protein
MNIALTIFGALRTFKKCLPDILDYIGTPNMDVYILTEKNGNFESDKKWITDLMTSHGNKIIKYDFINEIQMYNKKKEDKYVAHYWKCVKSFMRKHSVQNIATNHFVTRLIYRRYLLNTQLKNKKYDWVINTRFDIGYSTNNVIDQHDKTFIKNLLKFPPISDKIYVIPDTFSCGTQQAINYLMNMIFVWPFNYHYFKTNGRFPDSLKTSNDVRLWLFMPEDNLINYIKMSEYIYNWVPPTLTIVR